VQVLPRAPSAHAQCPGPALPVTLPARSIFAGRSAASLRRAAPARLRRAPAGGADPRPQCPWAAYAPCPAAPPASVLSFLRTTVPAPHTLPTPDLSLRRSLHLRPLLLLHPLHPLRLRPLRPLRPLLLLLLLHPLHLRPLRPLRQLVLPLFLCPRAFSHMVHAVMHTLSYGYSGRMGMDTCTVY